MPGATLPYQRTWAGTVELTETETVTVVENTVLRLAEQNTKYIVRLSIGIE